MIHQLFTFATLGNDREEWMESTYKIWMGCEIRRYGPAYLKTFMRYADERSELKP